MEIVIDQGNTRIKIALFHNDDIIEIKTFDNNESIDVNTMLNNLELKYPGNGTIDLGLFSSVGKINQNFVREMGSRIRLLILDPSLSIPVNIKYSSPETLGHDRIALAVAAHAKFPGHDVLVIDAGTCITCDFIEKAGKYLGGSISPGISMRFNALHTFTTNLPLVTQTKTPELIGDSTVKSIQSGVINGVKAEVMGFIEQYKSLYPSLIVVFTGGDLNYFDKNTKNNIFAIPNLVLLGLKEILEYNANK